MKLIALDVTNLTDARYFAAVGASYIGFDVFRMDLPTIKAIIPWLDVEGFILQYNGPIDQETIALHSQETGIEHVLVDLDKVEFKDLSTELTYFVMIHDASKIKEHDHIDSFMLARMVTHERENTFLNLHERLEHAKLFLEVDRDFHPEVPQLKNAGINGIFLRGSEEEKTGLKSFEDLDEVIEYYESDISYG